MSTFDFFWAREFYSLRNERCWNGQYVEFSTVKQNSCLCGQICCLKKSHKLYYHRETDTFLRTPRKPFGTSVRSPLHQSASKNQPHYSLGSLKWRKFYRPRAQAENFYVLGAHVNYRHLSVSSLTEKPGTV